MSEPPLPSVEWMVKRMAWYADALAAAQAERDAALAERDLAIAHDRQPYPTAYAYETVCAALAQWQTDYALVVAERDIAVTNQALLRDDYRELQTDLRNAQAERDRLREDLDFARGETATGTCAACSWTAIAEDGCCAACGSAQTRVGLAAVLAQEEPS